jgi:hypothetical protein
MLRLPLTTAHLRPGFPDALEYRGEAYLGLNRIADVKQVYLDLFASYRVLAAQLMQAIKTWIDLRRSFIHTNRGRRKLAVIRSNSSEVP